MDQPLKGSKDHREAKVKDNKFTFKNYLRNGFVHGLKYLGRKDKCEIFFWTFVLLVSVPLATFSIVFSSAFSGRSLTTLSSLPAKPIHFLPFPAITICSETKSQQNLAKFTEAYRIYQLNQTNDFSDVEISRIEALTQVCDPHVFQNIEISDNPTPGKDFSAILKEIAPTFILFCQFRGKIEECTKHFKQIVTDDGICYSFNKLGAAAMYKGREGKSDWSRENGYETEEFTAFPHRAFKGADVGFNVLLSLKSTDSDFICRGPLEGYKVKIHSPDEHPRMAQAYQRIPFNKETLIAVKPEFKTNDLQSNCFTTESKSLKFFKEYSQANCITECISSFILSECGCVKFSMLHENGTNICDQHKTKCVSENLSFFSTKLVFQNDFPCDCKPSCSELKYQAKVSQANFDFKRTFGAYKASLEDEFPDSVMSRLVVYIDEDHFEETSITTLRDSTFDSIAKIGGILAFFLGASFITIIEIFYYILRRVTG